MQSIDSASYLSKRIRFSGWIKADAPETVARLWVRVVPRLRDMGSFARGVFTASTEWTHGSVVVDVDPLSYSIMFGLTLEGPGQAWMSGADLEIVDESVPITEEGAVTFGDARAPTNLDFGGAV